MFKNNTNLFWHCLGNVLKMLVLVYTKGKTTDWLNVIKTCYLLDK